MKLDIPDRQRKLVIFAGSALALLILEYWVRAPLTNLWHAHSLEITRLQQQISDGRRTIKNAPRMARIWAEMQTNALPKDQGQADHDVSAALDGWRIANNIELTSNKPQWKPGATSKDKYSLYEIRLDLVGTLPTLTKFIWELERSPLALRVDSLELTSRDEGGSKISLGLIVSGLRLTPLEKIQK